MFFTDNRGLSVAEGFFYWQQWYLIDNRCLLLTTVVARWQEVLVTDNSGLSVAAGFFFWQQWYLVDNRCLLLTTVVARWQEVLVTDNSGLSLATGFFTDNIRISQKTGVSYWQQWDLTDNGVLVYYINADTV